MESRKKKRLSKYDYSTQGYYFITICSKDRINLFSSIVGQGLAPAELNLTDIGFIAEKQLLNLQNRYQNIIIDKYVIMPNHIHLILILNYSAGASPCPTVSDILCTYKSLTAKECKKISCIDIWQKSFYDHIIRDEKDYLRIWEYIDTNPVKWADDKYYNE